MSARGQNDRGRKTIIFSVVGLAISLFLIVVVLRRVDLELVWSTALRAKPWPLVASLGTKALGFVALAWRARALLRPVKPTPVVTLFQGQLLGFAANNVLPFRIGELAKVDYIARQCAISRATVLAAAAGERLLDLLCIAAVFILVAPVAVPERGEAALLTGAAAAGVVAAVVVVSRWPGTLSRVAAFVPHRWAGFAQRLEKTSSAFVRGLSGFGTATVFLEALLATVLYWTTALLGIRLWLLAFSTSVPWYVPAVVLVFLSFGTALPAAPGYVGTYHYFFIAALTLFSVDPEQATSVAVVGHFMALVPFTLVAAVLVPGEVRQLPGRVRAVLGPRKGVPVQQ